MLKIIEDCSPYYIRFKHEGIDTIINECLKFYLMFQQKDQFVHYKLPVDTARKILSLVPKAKELELNEYRCSLFITAPGHYYRAHRDGSNINVGINYPIQVLDDKCVTRWFDNSQFEGRAIDTRGGLSRELVGFDKTAHTPLKTMIAKVGEGVVFNTDVYHDFDNSDSKNIRVVLTLRSRNPDMFRFDDYRRILLG
jgi:hypothetical protein